MADYIYLLQNRLTPAQWRAVEAVREAARAHGLPVFLVGGAVRDLTTGSPVRDLDFAVQGDVEALIPELEAAGAQVFGRNQALSSAYLHFRGGVRGELGPSLSVSYPQPGHPEAQAAAILDDLRRRDFTANAMAVSLNEGSYGLLLDPLNGIADIENRELRLASNYGFIEQPALLLRAARLGERLGWTLEERTAARYQTAKEEGYIQALPAADRGYELQEILHEEDPLSILAHMEEEGWRDTLFPQLNSADGDRAGLEHVRDLVGQLEAQGIFADASALYFPLITAKLSDKDRAALKQMLARPGYVQQVEGIETRARELGAQLTSKAGSLPSESWRLLMNAEPELVLWLAVHVRTGAIQSRIRAFLKEWPQARNKIPYGLMQEMRITPDLPGYEKLVDDLFFALIDGKLETPEATRAFLEPYSPPAPPQVAVRRRPAKSARGRRRATEEVAPETADELSETDAAASETNEDMEDGEDPTPAPQDASESVREGDSQKTRPSQDEPPSTVVSPSSEKPAAKKTAKKAGAKGFPEQSTPLEVPVVAAKAAPARNQGGAKSGKTVEDAPKPVKPSSKQTAVVKQPLSSTQKTVPAKAAAKDVKKLPVKGNEKTKTEAPPAKSPKSAGKQAVAKRPEKVVAKKVSGKGSSVKGVPAKVVSTRSAPGKATSTKATGAKQALKKVAGKSVPAKGKSVSAPAKKVAAKGRGRK